MFVCLYLAVSYGNQLTLCAFFHPNQACSFTCQSVKAVLRSSLPATLVVSNIYNAADMAITFIMSVAREHRIIAMRPQLTCRTLFKWHLSKTVENLHSSESVVASVSW